jgi:4-amino-4-deoxy-L-arabinose transferase-like glycosyltransferase
MARTDQGGAVAVGVREALHTALAPAAILALALLMRLPLLTGGQIDYDEGVYWQSLRALVAGHRLFGEIYSSQPPGFLLLILPFFSLLGQTLIAARIGVLVFSLAGLLAVYRIGSLLADRRVALLAMTLLALDPISLRESVALQADGPAIALALISLALALQARSRGLRSVLLPFAAGALLALGVLVKPLAAAAGPPLLLALMMSAVPARDRLRGLALAASGGVVATAAILLPFRTDWGPMWEQAVRLHLVARGATVGGLDLFTAETELPLLALALAGLIVCFRRAPRLLALAGFWAACSALMLAVQRPIWPHHLLALSAPAALLAGGLALLPRLRNLDARPVAVLGAVLVAAGVGSTALVYDQETPNDTMRPAVARLQAATSPSQLVITDDQYLAALADRNTPPQLVDTSMVRVASGDLTSRSVEAIAAQSGTHAFLFSYYSASRLMGLPDLKTWVVSQFPHRVQLDRERVLYLP